MAIASANTLGNLLRSERERQGLSIETVTAETKIRPQYVLALEQDNYRAFSSSVHAKGFLLNYARMLGIDQQRVVSMYRRDVEASTRAAQVPNYQQLFKLPSLKQKRLWLGGVVVVVIILTFAAYQVSIALTPPRLILDTPQTIDSPGEFTYSTGSDTVILSGQVSPNTVVRINSGVIPLQPNAKFATSPIPLTSSRTTFVITATSPLRRETQIILHVLKANQPNE